MAISTQFDTRRSQQRIVSASKSPKVSGCKNHLTWPCMHCGKRDTCQQPTIGYIFTALRPTNAAPHGADSQSASMTSVHTEVRQGIHSPVKKNQMVASRTEPERLLLLSTLLPIIRSPRRVHRESRWPSAVRPISVAVQTGDLASCPLSKSSVHPASVLVR